MSECHSGERYTLNMVQSRSILFSEVNLRKNQNDTNVEYSHCLIVSINIISLSVCHLSISAKYSIHELGMSNVFDEKIIFAETIMPSTF